MAHNVDYKEIGRRIELCRKELNLTLTELASRVDLSASTIQRYEKGSFERIKLPVIEAIAEALHVNPGWLIGETEDKTPITQYSHYSTLSDAYYHSVINWSADKFFTVDETTVIRMHFADLLLRYKQLIENTSKNKRDLKRYLKAIAPFNSKTDSPLSTEKLIEQYWNQTLRQDLDDLKCWIDAFALHLSKTMTNEDIAGSVPTDKRDPEIEKWEVEEYRRRFAQLQPEQKPTPASRDGQDTLEEFVRKYKKNLTPGQEQKILEMMQAMIAQQKEPLSASAQQTTGEKSPKIGRLGCP